MAAPALAFSRTTPFDAKERDTIEALYAALAASGHPERLDLLEALRCNVERVDKLAEVLDLWPPVFQEAALGSRRRGVGTLVDRLARASDATVEMMLPTRALVGRALLMAELNAWRLMSVVSEQVLPASDGRPHPVARQVDEGVYACIHTRIAEDLLQSIGIDALMERRVREKAVLYLVHIWENRLTARVSGFFRLLEATWNARNRIRVNVGTLLGVSEMFRLLQAGCDPEFMAYFARPRLTRDEREAFQEFLIGVSTEQIHSLEQFMAQTGRNALSPEETAEVLHLQAAGEDENHPAVHSYRFFQERHLQAMARRLKHLPGPKKTAEEYVMIYYLEQELHAAARP
ncbi:MAG: hypothetical protein EYC70_13680 [Planctomycetota bacterium]|nr:MAG: hypothetical protein EYC70_13680 [Planctomycetota bacterium]